MPRSRVRAASIGESAAGERAPGVALGEGEGERERPDVGEGEAEGEGELLTDGDDVGDIETDVLDDVVCDGVTLGEGEGDKESPHIESGIAYDCPVCPHWP